MKSRYVVIGAIPFDSYSGTSFSGLRKIGEFYSLGQAEKAKELNSDRCGGLIAIFVVGEDNTREDSLYSS